MEREVKFIDSIKETRERCLTGTVHRHKQSFSMKILALIDITHISFVVDVLITTRAF